MRPSARDQHHVDDVNLQPHVLAFETYPLEIVICHFVRDLRERIEVLVDCFYSTYVGQVAPTARSRPASIRTQPTSGPSSPLRLPGAKDLVRVAPSAALGGHTVLAEHIASVGLALVAPRCSRIVMDPI